MTVNVIRGTNHNDTIDGTSGNDAIYVGQGGDDTINAGDGNDIIHFTANDSVDGGAGTDIVTLAGDYTGANAVTFLATTMVSVERLQMAAGYSYTLTTNDATVAAHAQFTVNAAILGASDVLTFDGSAETDGRFRILAGAGDDAVTGGARNDIFNLAKGGSDTAHGGGGADLFNMGGAFDASDTIDGGAGNDTIVLDGDYGPALTTIEAGQFTSIDVLKLKGSHSYNLAMADGNLATGATLTVDASGVTSGFVGRFDGSAETHGQFDFIGSANIAMQAFNGGAGDDAFDMTAVDPAFQLTLTGGACDNTLIGGAKHDVLAVSGGNSTNANSFTGGGGADSISASIATDTFVYTSASDSTSTNYDSISSPFSSWFDLSVDRFDVPGTVNAIDAAVTSGSLSTATFDSDLTTALGGHLFANDAILFTPDSGTLSGQTFLVVDLNGSAGYQSGSDLVIHISNYSGTLSTSDFI